MKRSKPLIPDHHRINRDQDGTFMYYAKLAARNESGGNHSAAEALWLKAMKVAVKPINREWADKRAAVCKQMITRWFIPA